MKKTLKFGIFLLLSIILGLTVCACGSSDTNDDPIIGTWKRDDSSFTVTFNDSGEYIVTANDGSESRDAYEYKRTDKKNGYEARVYQLTEFSARHYEEAVIYENFPDYLKIDLDKNILIFKRVA